MTPSPFGSARWTAATQQWWKARNLRERALLTLVGIALVLALLDTLVWRPMLKEQAKLRQRIAAAELASADLNARLQPASDASSRLAIRITDAQNELNAADAAINDLRRKVVAPAQMASQIRGLLTAAKDLEVLSFKNSAARALDTDGGNAPGRPIGLYRHPLEIRVTGSYTDIVRWIAHIEHGIEGVFLTGALLERVPAGRIEARIDLFTLGTEATWLTL